MKLRQLKLISLLSLASLSTLALADPSGRVGRISSTQGTVTFRNNASGDAQLASVNWPVTSDNELITDSNARAEFRVGSAAVRLDGNTDLEIQQLDDNHFRLRLNRGSAEIRIRNQELARDFSIDTPQGHILLSEPSSVRIDARYDSPLTALTVQSGSVTFDGGNARFALPAGRHAEVADGDLRVLQSSSAYGTDSFDSWTAARDRQDERSMSARYLSAETTGYEELDNHGAWRVTSTYGPVWSPSAVPVDWAPYRDGRWTWISPWGWTWVDNAPWGYAPSHYGRWVFYDQRWCWTPGAVVAQPVWAPALVGWVGGRSWEVGFSVGSAPSVGWFPLAPREVYVPSYQVTPRYVQQINNTYIVNGNVQIQNNHYYNGSTQNYQNQSVQNAVTVMPQSQFTVSKTVLVTPTVLAPRQVALLRSAPASAVSPVVSAPRAVSNPPAPDYQQRVAPMTGPLMHVEHGRTPQPAAFASTPPVSRAVATQPSAADTRMQTPLRNEPMPLPGQRMMSAPAPLMSRVSPAEQSGQFGSVQRQRPVTELHPSDASERRSGIERREGREVREVRDMQEVRATPQQHVIAVSPPPMQAPAMHQVAVQPAPARIQAAPPTEPHRAAEPRQARHSGNEREGFGRPGSAQETR